MGASQARTGACARSIGNGIRKSAINTRANNLTCLAISWLLLSESWKRNALSYPPKLLSWLSRLLSGPTLVNLGTDGLRRFHHLAIGRVCDRYKSDVIVLPISDSAGQRFIVILEPL